MTIRRCSIAASVALSMVLGATSVFAQGALPTTPAAGSTTRGKPAVYTFTAKAPGFLTIVLRGDSSADLVLVLSDADGQPLGESDQDIGGNVAAEQLAVPIGAAGSYRVSVETHGDQGSFRIGSSFLPFPELAQAPDPDGSPRSAQAVEANKSVEDSVNPADGDSADWYVFKSPAAGTLTAVMRGTSDGDLVLEVFADGDFRSNIGRSDQDLQGNAGNESVTASVTSGQSLYFRVSANWRGASTIPYRLTIGFIPD